MKKKYKEARLKNISQWHMNRVEHCNIWDIYEREPDIPRLPENTNCSINWQTLSGSIWDRLNLRNPSFVYNCAIGAIQSVWSGSPQRRVVTLFPKRGGQVESGDLLFYQPLLLLNLVSFFELALGCRNARNVIAQECNLCVFPSDCYFQLRVSIPWIHTDGVVTVDTMWGSVPWKNPDRDRISEDCW